MTEQKTNEQEPPSRPDKEAPEFAGGSSGIAVVGLGGSAGALKSFEDFFTAMPADSGAAFVIIQHLAPTHASLLPELVAQHTRMKVVQAQEAVPVEPNCVYIIPPDHYLGIRDGVLYLTEAVKQDGIRMPIDFFFRSLAEDRQERAIGILFSGAGSDGTLGVRAIRGGGGLAMAQDPQTAQFDSMPRSAIATGTGGLHPAAGSDARVAPGIPPASLRPGRRTGCRPGGRREARRRTGHPDPGAGANGLRFSLLQKEHHLAAHRTADGPAPHLRCGPVQQPASSGRQ